MQLPEKARAAALNAAGSGSSNPPLRSAPPPTRPRPKLPPWIAKWSTATQPGMRPRNSWTISRTRATSCSPRIKWENQLRTASAAQVIQGFVATRTELADRLVKLKAAADSYRAAALALARPELAWMVSATPSCALQKSRARPKSLRLSVELRKEAGLERLDKDGPVVPQGSRPRRKCPLPIRSRRRIWTGPRSRLPSCSNSWRAAFAYLRNREFEEDLLTAQNDLEKKATAYLQALAEARLDDLRLNAAAVELKSVLAWAKLPAKNPGRHHGSPTPSTSTKLGSKTAAVLNSLDLLQQEHDKLLRPRPCRRHPGDRDR